MFDSDQVTRDVGIVNATITQRSTAEMLCRPVSTAVTSTATSVTTLREFNGHHVTATLRDGRILIGLLETTRDHLTIGRIAYGLPCRYRFKHDDIIGCELFESHVAETQPTQPIPPRHMH